MNDEIKKILNNLPDLFTAHEFKKEAIKLGYGHIFALKADTRDVLKEFAKNLEPRSKTYKKNYVPLVDEKKQNNLVTFFNDEEIISYLKNKGFKILASKQEWKEL